MARLVVQGYETSSHNKYGDFPFKRRERGKKINLLIWVNVWHESRFARFVLCETEEKTTNKLL